MLHLIGSVFSRAGLQLNVAVEVWRALERCISYLIHFIKVLLKYLTHNLCPVSVGAEEQMMRSWSKEHNSCLETGLWTVHKIICILKTSMFHNTKVRNMFCCILFCFAMFHYFVCVFSLTLMCCSLFLYCISEGPHKEQLLSMVLTIRDTQKEDFDLWFAVIRNIN